MHMPSAAALPELLVNSGLLPHHGTTATTCAMSNPAAATLTPSLLGLGSELLETILGRLPQDERHARCRRGASSWTV